MTGILQPNGVQSSYRYDAAGRLASLDNRQQGAATPQSAYAYSLDRVGNRTQVVQTRAAFDGSAGTVTLTHDYGYDALNRLTSAATDTPASSSAYSFDRVGNRTAKTGSALAPDAGLPALPVSPNPLNEQSRYNAANQLVQSGDATLGYDDNGNRRSETRTLPNGQTETTNYRYDREDRLVGVTKRVGDSVMMQAVYAYDGYGRRARKTVSYPGDPSRDQCITYTYDGLEIIGATIEEKGTSSDLAFYLAPSPLTGLRRPYAMEDLGSRDRYWLQSDGMDSVVALTDEQGRLVAPMLYDEYGQHLAGDATIQLFSYTAQDYDPETGLLHFYARYYDPAHGVWLTQDTYRGQTAAPETLHRYGYAGGNPTIRVDKDGHFFQIIVVVAVAGLLRTPK
ncbi:MAG: RHS repeat-associated core domain-containing protein [Oscillochloris sp.]|nr:RHS repeat-associated core domain-containing protein [Oscillochloris sp.]